MIRAFRICDRKWADTAFNGDGARLHGGRWNHKGVSMVYLASSVALAQLEIMVHLDSETLLRQNFVFISIDFDESLVEDLPLAERPHEWEDFRVQQRCKQYGSEWARSGRSALLRVPSAVVPADDNYLLNPRHPAIDTMVVSRPCSMGFDMRLFRERRD